MFYVINGALQRKFLTCLSFALGIDANARPRVRFVKMIDRSPSLMLQCGIYVINGTLQREFLTRPSFVLGVDTNARPTVS